MGTQRIMRFPDVVTAPPKTTLKESKSAPVPRTMRLRDMLRFSSKSQSRQERQLKKQQQREEKQLRESQRAVDPFTQDQKKVLSYLGVWDYSDDEFDEIPTTIDISEEDCRAEISGLFDDLSIATDDVPSKEKRKCKKSVFLAGVREKTL